MNAVEIEAALSTLAGAEFDRNDFPFSFLRAFGNKETTIKRLRKGKTNKSDVPGGVLQRNNIHLAVTPDGEVGPTLNLLRESEQTAQAKAKFILATDGVTLEAEDLASGETIACDYAAFPDHFGFFLPLAGITTVQEIKDNPVDVRATGRLNKLYVELLQENEDWARAERRPDMNHFMARLIFCFFAEDTDIFPGQGEFTITVDQMSERDGSNTHEVVSTLFRSMNLKPEERKAAGLPNWANKFPYVNGGLFSGKTDVPRFSRTARSYLFQAGQLDWKAINPDIFGSMIQAVADDEERGALGMHYTSVPNILKVLNPLFLDDLRAQLEAAGDSKVKLLNLRKRMARIRVFDPACGSGNFLVIAYKQMRAIEGEINRRRNEMDRPSDIPLTNFRGIELRHFPAEIARLALIIAEFQCDVLYRGPQEALKFVLPLDSRNWITCGNALRLDWQELCPSAGQTVKLVADDLFSTPLDQSLLDFENKGGETYICGNPPYKGSQEQTKEQKLDLEVAFGGRIKSTRSADYVSGWFIKARDFIADTDAQAAFVTTNSINQGRQVSLLWGAILVDDLEIRFAVPSFKWSNLAAKKAAVNVSVVGLGPKSGGTKKLYDDDIVREVDLIGPYLVPNQSTIVAPASRPISDLSEMANGSMPNDGGGLLLEPKDARQLLEEFPSANAYVRRFLGSKNTINGGGRYCLWIEDADVQAATAIPTIAERVEQVRKSREASTRATTQSLAATPHRFGEVRHSSGRSLVIPRHSAETRPYLPFDLVDGGVSVIGDSAIALPDYRWHEVAVFASRLHIVWIATVCGKIKDDYRYSNRLGWNTFPVPALTSGDRLNLQRTAHNIVLTREAHFPATLADLYDPDEMPDDLRQAHERNDEVVERIYIGRRFRNDTERLEKLFDLYNSMSSRKGHGKKKGRKARSKK